MERHDLLILVQQQLHSTMPAVGSNASQRYCFMECHHHWLCQTRILGMPCWYVRKRRLGDARVLFDRMAKREEVSWNTMISNGMVDEAERVFDKMPVKNSVSWNAMIAGYLKCKRIDVAKELFDAMPCKNMPRRDCISWGAIISGYAHLGHNEEALRLFVEMKRSGEKANGSIFSCILSTYAEIAALELGYQLHAQLVKMKLTLYEKISDTDIVSWNTIIDGYAWHGFGQEALRVFESMKRSGVKPDQVTMIEAHTTLHNIMNRDYGIAANSKHYTCMIDFHGRAGRLDDAQNLMRSMPFEPDAATWGIIYGNTELGEKAAEMVFQMEPDNAGMYVLLSNLYAASGRWADVGAMRLKMRDTGVKKVPELDFRLKKEGYISSPKLVLHDAEEEEKEHMLSYHGEKLAVAFGIHNIQGGRPIRVFKNLC
ncbi:hypothetical protein CTI12_AA314360 [Artemisia annua]|uniref:DYW domain-containing protein n=1 Tax=Artemisia annua TaxID=35608 RepID=A0A2U1N2R6_ARTAN|nr:hypothetical protein CTI12_AA314360 [Artemisia annua]